MNNKTAILIKKIMYYIRKSRVIITHYIIMICEYLLLL